MLALGVGVIIWALVSLSLRPAAPASGWSKSGCFGSKPLQTSDGRSDLAIHPGSLISQVNGTSEGEEGVGSLLQIWIPECFLVVVGTCHGLRV